MSRKEQARLVFEGWMADLSPYCAELEKLRDGDTYNDQFVSNMYAAFCTGVNTGEVIYGN